MSTAYARRRRALWTAKPRLTDGELWQSRESRARCREQEACLVNTEGWIFMQSNYDAFPPAIRHRLQISPFNLCPACVAQWGGDVEAIERMEGTVRRLQRASP